MHGHNPLVEARGCFSGSRVLITGGRGFIGCHLARRLGEMGARVRIFDCLDGQREGFECVTGDIRDSSALREATRNCRVVFHFAALLGVERTLHRCHEVLSINLGGTVNLLDAAARNDVERVVFASSSEVYGEPCVSPVREETKACPVSTYGLSKVAAEACCTAFACATGMRSTCLRFFNVYGPGQSEEFVIPRFIARLARGKPPIVYGTGEQLRTFTYVSDAIDCTLLASSREEGVNQTFNVGSAESITIAELAQLVGGLFGYTAGPMYRDFGGGIRPPQREIHRRIPDASRAQRLLGFKSRVSIREGLRKCYEWYLAHRYPPLGPST